MEAIHFLHRSRAVFQNPHFIDTYATVIHMRLYMTDDRFDNFPLMADKIRIRSTDKCFVVQSNNEAIKRYLYGVLWSFGVQ